jgi:predicted membrane protein
MNKLLSSLWLASSILLSLGGIAAFIYLFVLDFNIYWLILSPVILAVYQIPAAYVLWLWKKRKAKKDKICQTDERDEMDGIDETDDFTG